MNTPITHGEAESCCNVQWLLFVLGLFFIPASYVGALLPLCSKPTFPTRCHKCARPLRRCLDRGSFCSLMTQYLRILLALACCIHKSAAVALAP